MKLFLLASLALASPAVADVDRVIDDHILPGYDRFAQDTAALAGTAGGTCEPAKLRPAWNAAFDAWMGVSHINFGPVEEAGRALAIAFWPDTRGATPAMLSALIADADPIVGTAEGTAEISVAARGLFALEYLLYDPQFEAAGDYGCALVRALAGDLARIAGAVESEWREGYAETLRSAGAEGNPVFLSGREAQQTLFSALVAGLEFTADQRLGRPLGSFDRPRPSRAEARRSERSLRNVALSIEALHDLARDLTDVKIPRSDAAFARAADLATALDDPAFAGVDAPQTRLEIEILQQAVHAARDAVLLEIGASLGIEANFNAGDGD